MYSHIIILDRIRWWLAYCSRFYRKVASLYTLIIGQIRSYRETETFLIPIIGKIRANILLLYILFIIIGLYIYRQQAVGTNLISFKFGTKRLVITRATQRVRSGIEMRLLPIMSVVLAAIDSSLYSVSSSPCTDRMIFPIWNFCPNRPPLAVLLKIHDDITHVIIIPCY